MGTNDKRPMSNRNNTEGTASSSKYASALSKKARGGTIKWSQVNGPLIKDCIGFVTASGDAITFGRTTDGGALSVTILSGNDRLKDYASTVAEAEEMLLSIIEATGQKPA